MRLMPPFENFGPSCIPVHLVTVSSWTRFLSFPFLSSHGVRPSAQTRTDSVSPSSGRRTALALLHYSVCTQQANLDPNVQGPSSMSMQMCHAGRRTYCPAARPPTGKAICAV